MTDKKKRTSALPSDPLAWLDLPVQAEASSSDEVTVTDDRNIACTGEHVEATVAMQDDDDGGFGFFANEENGDVENPADDEDGGFGFFANEQSTTADNAAPADDEEGGFGFFANEETPEMDAGSPVDDEEGGFGFFANEDSPMSGSADGAIVFESTLTIKNIEDWHQRLTERLSEGVDISLRADDLNQIDGCGLQLLCSLFASARAKGVSVQWESVSERLSTSAGYFGVGNLLELDNSDQKAA